MTIDSVTIPEITAAIRNVPDFPQAGIQFKDITPVLADARLFTASIDHLVSNFTPGSVPTDTFMLTTYFPGVTVPVASSRTITPFPAGIFLLVPKC